MHELDEPVVDGSTLLMVVGQRAGIGDILVDIESFQAEGKLKRIGAQVPAVVPVLAAA